jgi:hypothetical protein
MDEIHKHGTVMWPGDHMNDYPGKWFVWDIVGVKSKVCIIQHTEFKARWAHVPPNELEKTTA